MTTTEKETKDNFFNDDNKPDSNWFKFEKVGDKVKGEVVEIYDSPAKGVFTGQKVFSLKQDDGNVVNVGIPTTKIYLINRTKGVELGDTLGFMFKEEIKSATAGFAPAKSIEAYVVKSVKKAESLQDF